MWKEIFTVHMEKGERMTKLIDADALLDDLLFPSKQFEKGMRELINDAPTIDAVEVVRCKDCVYQSGIDSDQYCYLDGRSACDYNFCSWGERK